MDTTSMNVSKTHMDHYTSCKTQNALQTAGVAAAIPALDATTEYKKDL